MTTPLQKKMVSSEKKVFSILIVHPTGKQARTLDMFNGNFWVNQLKSICSIVGSILPNRKVLKKQKEKKEPF